MYVLIWVVFCAKWYYTKTLSNPHSNRKTRWNHTTHWGITMSCTNKHISVERNQPITVRTVDHWRLEIIVVYVSVLLLALCHCGGF